MKKLVSIVLALAMILLVGAAFASSLETAKITIENANPGQTYTFIRVFDASIGTSGVRYTVIPGKTLSENDYFAADTQGNVTVTEDAKDASDNSKLSAEAITWLKENATTIGVTEKTAQLASSATEPADLEVTGLTPGYYYITTTTGTAVSVHTSSGTTVADKNPGTTIDKTITSTDGGHIDEDGNKAFAQIGKTVKFEARIPVANGAKNYLFEDEMSNGLTLDQTSVKVYITETDEAVAANATEAGNYGTLTIPSSGDIDIRIAFADAFVNSNVGKDIVVKYEAVINSSAVITEAGNPNTAHIYWGNKDNYLHDDDTVKVYTAQVGVFKTQNNESTPLANAGFKLKNASGQYYKLVSGAVTWVTETAASGDTPAVAGDEHLSDAAGNVAPFTGLQNGTYYLEESTVPGGFNKAADVTVTISDSSYGSSNISQTKPVQNNSGTTLPSTGGIGTTIFYVLGGILVIGAAVILIARRKAHD